MAECKRLIAKWKKKTNKAAAWYKKPLHSDWYKNLSEVSDITRTYKINIRANPEALIIAA